MNFNPIIDPIKVVRKNIRHKFTGSLKKIIPIITVPTAPIPVHTAYAVPIGKCSKDLIKKYILATMQIAKEVYHKYISLPVVSFALPKLDAKPTSNKPAITKKIQLILYFHFLLNLHLMMNRHSFYVNKVHEPCSNQKFLEHHQKSHKQKVPFLLHLQI